MAEIYNGMKVAAYDGHTVYIYPTGTAVHMADVFKSKNGAEKLASILSQQLGKEIKVVLTEAQKTKEKKKDLMQQAAEVFGELKELENE